jgi:hypothetical protein
LKGSNCSSSSSSTDNSNLYTITYTSDELMDKEMIRIGNEDESKRIKELSELSWSEHGTKHYNT